MTKGTASWRRFAIPTAGGATPLPMTSHPCEAGFSVVILILKKKRQALHENQQEQEMKVAVPSDSGVGEAVRPTS